MKIKALGHVVVRVTDRERAERFYGGVLGLPLCARFDEVASRWRSLPLATHHDFAVMEVTGEGSSRSETAVGLHHVAFNIGTTIDELREAKAKLDVAGIATTPVDHEVTKVACTLRIPTATASRSTSMHPTFGDGSRSARRAVDAARSCSRGVKQARVPHEEDAIATGHDHGIPAQIHDRFRRNCDCARPITDQRRLTVSRFHAASLPTLERRQIARVARLAFRCERIQTDNLEASFVLSFAAGFARRAASPFHPEPSRRTRCSRDWGFVAAGGNTESS
jgi:catechol 2,3-dioxygenase-like lactoylglutathione lyase family enzyme